jgi:putative nucleotidyltransferase with HDIG domain
MASEHAILLISDRPNQSWELARGLGALCACQMIGLHEQKTPAGAVIAVVTDVGLRHPRNVERLRNLLLQPRASAVPIVAILRDDSHLERVQAAAVGATSLFGAHAAISEISAALAPAIRSTIVSAAPAAQLTPAQNVEQARLEFGTLFGAAARGELVGRTEVDKATTSVVAAITDGGIRQWLEVVWAYHDATYQHCLLVTGLAAEFAVRLKFTQSDQQHLVRGALLHDIGKARIPLAILNKPESLTGEQLATMRTHARIGYEILHEQGGYEPELLEVVLRHHELLDGSGYPDGLSGPQIPDLVRLVTICDIYAALIERRPYRQPIQPALAFNMLQEMNGKLETALVNEFARVVEKSTAAPVLSSAAAGLH